MDDVCLESATLNTVRQLSHLCIPFSSLPEVPFASHRVREMVAFESVSLFSCVAMACSSLISTKFKWQDANIHNI